MIEGERVRLKSDAPLRRQHPELAEAIGIVSSVIRKGSLSAGQESVKMHVRFQPPVNLVAFNVPAAQFEPAERIEPRPRNL
ncbi:hypothetical protein [Lichenifustis flavocetrariae]|uniref:Uncharacterized protein n=1 Tax=Lichenifustis flavocetrariae TaxID=2949735 RepID=A0AA41Z315_9HYPH|nr:hypothetical protein [Lichenifustis flavocetrariae]MCW6509593.1 hypothetical protein [Lichenifustis flavocetrariae]